MGPPPGGAGASPSPSAPTPTSECSAISLKYLGMGFDLEGGGSDLTFPHHEMSASHAQVATGSHPHARAYVHAGMVALDGEKMSKSKGNLVFVSKPRQAGTDPMAIRLALLSHHYRSDWEWTGPELVAAQARLARWRAAGRLTSGPPGGPLLNQVRRALGHDPKPTGALAPVERGAQRTGTDTRAPAPGPGLAGGLLGGA